MKASELRPAEYNPRTISDVKLQALKKSMGELGDISGFVYNHQTGNLVGGHQRLKCIPPDAVVDKKRLAETTKAGTIAEGSIMVDGERWNYREVDWPLSREKLANIAANKHGGDWDEDKLKEIMAELKNDSTVDIDLSGFNPIEIDEMLAGYNSEPDEEDDVIPEIDNENVITQTGDLFSLGDHRLLCGDSTKREDVERLMDGKKAELLFTSPPYADMREYEGCKDLGIDHLSDFIIAYEPYCRYQVVNLGIKRENHEIVSYWDEYITKARSIGYKFLAWNVWAKQNAGSVGNQSSFIPISHEWMFVFGKGFKDINRTEKRKSAVKRVGIETSRRQPDGQMKRSSCGRQGVFKEMESVYYQVTELGAIRKLHPATFPVDLAGKYVRSITSEGNIIVDPFLGSGSTLIAAEKTKRICHGMEIAPRYCDVIIARWEKYTGNKAIKC